jgi:serine/threonine protein kinase
MHVVEADTGQPVLVLLQGAVLQMVSGQPPWFDAKVSTPVALLQAMLQRHGQPPPFPEGLSASLTKFLERCFRWDPARRPSAAKLLHEVS